MHVNLTPTLDDYVLAKVKSGRYNNASEVVREAIRRMQDEEARNSTGSALGTLEIDEIRRNVRQGIDEIERGEGTEYVGERGLRKLFRDVRSQGVKELGLQRRKKTKR